ncbi:hypothetical protein [Rosenbergiella metrosideri]|uniref:hypothetical protein n=1 Tax=Rosenbergiella metrosideri TaxID=2921185 RepID=UPI001F4FACC5|nr:hypothetical protein [Rosenbergiella metrosideri]
MRSHFFSVTLADNDGRMQTSIIKHSERNLTAPVINAQLDEVNAYQPVIIASINYLGKMSDHYFETGFKKLVDHWWSKWVILPSIGFALGTAAYWLSL